MKWKTLPTQYLSYASSLQIKENFQVSLRDYERERHKRIMQQRTIHTHDDERKIQSKKIVDSVVELCPADADAVARSVMT